MTSRGKDELDDEFEGFVRGRGELARQTAEQQQPVPAREAAARRQAAAELARLPLKPAQDK